MTTQTILAGAAALALTLGGAGSAAAAGHRTSKPRRAAVTRSADVGGPVDLGLVLQWLVPADGEGSVPAIGIVTDLLEQLGLEG